MSFTKGFSKYACPGDTITCAVDGFDVMRDAYAEWDEEKQEWVLRTYFDDSVCDHCGATACLEEQELGDPTDKIAVAHDQRRD